LFTLPNTIHNLLSTENNYVIIIFTIAKIYDVVKLFEIKIFLFSNIKLYIIKLRYNYVIKLYYVIIINLSKI
jgi:hypothetical protein